MLTPTSERRHSTSPTGHSVIDPPLLLSSLSIPIPPRPVPLSQPLDSRLLLTLFPTHTPCLEVNPPNIVHPLTSNPPSHSIIIITIIINNKNNILPLKRPPPPIPKTLLHAHSLSSLDPIWISSQILSSSPLLPPQSTHLLYALLPSAEIQLSLLSLVSPNRTAALPVVHPELPPPHQVPLAMAALPHKPNRSYHRSSPLPLPPIINGVSLRPPCPIL